MTATAAAVASALSTLLARLTVETEPSVRAAICEALGRIPYTETSQVLQVEAALLGLAQSEIVTERLGVVKGFESMILVSGGRWSPSAATVAILRELVEATAAFPQRDARIRRLAFEALMTAGEVDSTVIERGSADPDPQVRRLAMRAAGIATGSRIENASSILRAGLTDPQPLVRMEALRGVGMRERGSFAACRHLIGGVHDPLAQVSLVSLDLLGDCNVDPEAVGLLEYAVNDLSSIRSPRGWHRAAHALVALSRAVPDRARAVLGQFTASSNSHVRAYAARAAIVLKDPVTLETLANDPDDTVAQIATEGLGRTSGQSAGQVRQAPRETDLTASELQRLAAPKARVTIRGVGTFELALFTSHAPAAVLRFAKLAESGVFNGSPLGGVTPTTVSLISQFEVNRGNGEPRPDEIGSWPHVRGAVGLASWASSSGKPQVFINLVDNPRFDHRYPVFAQVLNGIELIDQILEGDIVERIEIVAGP
jgi:cyclophilin family peptidyl-prolyl cis-trans isomerase